MPSIATQSAVAATLAVAGVLGSLLAAPSVEGAFGATLAAVMLAIAAIDARSRIIPNELTAITAILALVHEAWLAPDAGLHAVGAGVIRAATILLLFWLLSAGFRRLRGRDGLGFGDVKLAAVAGLFLDWFTIVLVVEAAALSAIIVHLSSGLFGRRPLTANTEIPFGLFLAPAIWLGWLYQTLI
nr:A24 family peptidase [Rhodopseudomonas rhenobacensis]